MKGAAGRKASDPTIYPEEERVGEDILQRWIIEVLRPLLQRWLTSRRVRALVGADQFIYYRQHDAHARVAPDIYVLPGIDPHHRVHTWKIWIEHVVPSFALEIVLRDWQDGYIDVLERYILTRLRVATDTHGDALLATPEEEVASARREKRQCREAKGRERDPKEATLTRVRTLEAAAKRLRG